MVAYGLSRCLRKGSLRHSDHCLWRKTLPSPTLSVSNFSSLIINYRSPWTIPTRLRKPQRFQDPGQSPLNGSPPPYGLPVQRGYSILPPVCVRRSARFPEEISMSYTHTSSVRLEFPHRVELNGINLPGPQKDRGWILRLRPCPSPWKLRVIPPITTVFSLVRSRIQPAPRSQPTLITLQKPRDTLPILMKSLPFSGAFSREAGRWGPSCGSILSSSGCSSTQSSRKDFLVITVEIQCYQEER